MEYIARSKSFFKIFWIFPGFCQSSHIWSLSCILDHVHACSYKRNLVHSCILIKNFLIYRSQPSELACSSYTSMFSFFEFQRNENSVSLRIAMLLYLAFLNASFKLIPFFSVDIPFKKKGPAYQTDYILTNTEIEDIPKYKLIRGGKLVMVIEIKKTVNTNFTSIEPHDVLELMVYCQYLMRLYDKEMILGSLTDGRVWHTIKFGMEEDMLMIMKYGNIIAKDDMEVIGSVPNLLTL